MLISKVWNKISILLSVLVLSAGCASTSNNDTLSADIEDDGETLTVYTSFYVMNDFTKKIAQDKADIINLVPAGAEPHDWEPKAKDMAELEKADIFIYNGAGMEPWVDKILKELKNDKLIVIEASREVQLLEEKHSQKKDPEIAKSSTVKEPEDDHGHDHGKDPHFWLNPIYAKMELESIKNGFIKADPDNQEFYEKNYKENANKMDTLFIQYKNSLEQYKGREIIVAHEAFGYLCEAFGLKQVAIEGLMADSEPSPARMAEIIDFAKQNNVKVIFFEELVNPKIAEAIAKEVGAVTDVLNPLEGISDEDLEKGKDYFSVMEDNLAALKKAFE